MGIQTVIHRMICWYRDLISPPQIAELRRVYRKENQDRDRLDYPGLLKLYPEFSQMSDQDKFDQRLDYHECQRRLNALLRTEAVDTNSRSITQSDGPFYS